MIYAVRMHAPLKMARDARDLVRRRVPWAEEMLDALDDLVGVLEGLSASDRASLFMKRMEAEMDSRLLSLVPTRCVYRARDYAARCSEVASLGRALRPVPSSEELIFSIDM